MRGEEEKERGERELTRTCKAGPPPRGRARERARGTRWENLNNGKRLKSASSGESWRKEGRKKRTVLQSIAVLGPDQVSSRFFEGRT